MLRREHVIYPRKSIPYLKRWLDVKCVTSGLRKTSILDVRAVNYYSKQLRDIKNQAVWLT